jgi:flavin reductase (DIM6/NTAB) family NADH-FMN oxidoreductase RutF
MSRISQQAAASPAFECDADKFKAGMRKFASGVTLITSSNEGTRAGLVATAVSSVSTTPPTLLICVNRSASAHDVIDKSGSFAVNVLSANDLHLIEVFSRSALRDQRFKVGDWGTLVTGAPVLASAMASFDCEVV